MGKSRVTNTFYNFFTSIGGQLLTIVLQFVVRTIFIKSLGKEYLGINGLFTNILQMLSLAELGVGSAILFKLYEPLSQNNKKRIVLLLSFYKKVYQLIGLVITIVGIMLIPFLRYIVSDYDSLKPLGINAILIYILFLLKTVVSYFFLAYKSAIIKADQKEYKLNLISYLTTIITSLLQIVTLILYKNFELYILVSIITLIVQNFLNARLANKLYPYINEKYNENISKKEIKEIFKDCGALLIYRINGVVLKATDNIIISIYLGLKMVGIYSNYYILYSTIDNILGKIFESALHSLGNLHTTKNYKHEYQVFKSINLLAVIVGITAGIGVACISNEFINVWIGKEWILTQPFAILMGVELFGVANRQFLGKYRSAMGLFQQAKYRPIAGMIINLVLSLLLVNKYGICGVLIGTIAADWLTVMWYDPLIIHKYGLNSKFPVHNYYKKNIFNAVVGVLLGIVCNKICNSIFINCGWTSIIIHGIIICIIVPITFGLLYLNKEEMYLFKNIIKKIINK